MTTGPTRLDGSDVDGLCEAARADAAERSADRRVDWDGVRRLARRRRRIQTAVAVWAGVLTVAAAAIATLVLRGPASDEGRDGGSSPAVAAAPAVEYRIVRPSDRVYVVASRATVVASISPSEVALRSGTVWVRVDCADGPVPFVVATHDVRVSVHGTRFAVSADPLSGTTVAVLDGVVRVRRGGADVELAAATQIRPADPAPAPIDRAWRASLAELLPDTTPRCAAAAPATAPGPSPVPASPPPGPVGPPPATAPAGHATATAVPAPADFEALYRDAERALGERRFLDAVRFFERAAAIEPGSERSGRALMDAGQAAVRAGREDLAASAFERYLAEQPRGQMRDFARVMLCRLRSASGTTSCEATVAPDAAPGRAAGPGTGERR